jgi:4-hydroxy-3-methylbut-2-enyl diphosphate reductase
VGVSTVAVTAGASAPEVLVEGVVDYLRQSGFDSVEEDEAVVENVHFNLPSELTREIRETSRAQPVGSAVTLPCVD